MGSLWQGLHSRTGNCKGSPKRPERGEGTFAGHTPLPNRPCRGYFPFYCLGETEAYEELPSTRVLQKIYTGFEPRFTPHLSYFRPYTQAIQGNKEGVHFGSRIVQAWCEGKPGTSGRMGTLGRAGRCPGCSGTLLGAPSPTPVGPRPPQCLLIWPPCAHAAPEYTGGANLSWTVRGSIGLPRPAQQGTGGESLMKAKKGTWRA